MTYSLGFWSYNRPSHDIENKFLVSLLQWIANNEMNFYTLINGKPETQALQEVTHLSLIIGERMLFNLREHSPRFLRYEAEHGDFNIWKPSDKQAFYKLLESTPLFIDYAGRPIKGLIDFKELQQMLFDNFSHIDIQKLKSLSAWFPNSFESSYLQIAYQYQEIQQPLIKATRKNSASQLEPLDTLKSEPGTPTPQKRI